jgi:hypothetical protein
MLQQPLHHQRPYLQWIQRLYTLQHFLPLTHHNTPSFPGNKLYLTYIQQYTYCPIRGE